MPLCTCEGQEITFQSQFSSSTMWEPRERTQVQVTWHSSKGFHPAAFICLASRLPAAAVNSVAWGAALP